MLHMLPHNTASQDSMTAHPRTGENLLFSIAWSEFKDEFVPHIRYLNQVNVVMHATAEPPSPCARQRFHSIVYGRDPCAEIRTASKIAPLSQGHTVSRRAHYRINGGPTRTEKALRGYESGKFLLFGTGNTIRAGKSSHAHAALAMYTFWAWVNKAANLPPARWPSMISAPNMVVTGQFTEKISAGIKKDDRVTWSTKFPGIAVTTPYGSTPELYLRQSRFIVPGVVSASQLAQILRVMVDLFETYRTGEPSLELDHTDPLPKAAQISCEP